MQTIPKKIHYIWVGENPKPDIVLKCIESWKKYFPDYEITEWNEQNYDVHKNRYLAEAYAAKKWAFVSDYMRFDVLNQYGGIYFDTDVEVLRPFPEEILEKEAFTGMESAGKVNPGLIFACNKGNWLTGLMMDSYHADAFDEKHLVTVNMRLTGILEKYGLKKQSGIQVVNGVAIYPSSYFCGYDQDVQEYDIRPETCCVHHYAGTWKKKSMKRKIQAFLKKIVGVENYRKLLKIKRHFLGVYNK